METNRGADLPRLAVTSDLRSRGRFGILGRSGAVVGFALVVVASALAFALTDSTAARTTLPPQIEVGGGTTTTVPSIPTTTSASASTSTSVPSVSTSVPTTTIAAASSDVGKTTVVQPLRTVHVEDDHGNQLDDEGTEAASGTSEHETGDN